MVATMARKKTETPKPEPPASDVGPRLRAFIARKGHAGLKEAADASGRSYQQLYDIAAGIKVPRVDTLENIVADLGGTMAEFYATKIPKL